MAGNKTISKKVTKKKASVKKEAKRAYGHLAGDSSGDHKKAERISLRVSEAHKKAITEASELAGFKNVNDYIIHISLADSQKVVREHKLLTLSGQDSIAFLEALHHSQEINESLQRAMNEFVAKGG